MSSHAFKRRLMHEATFLAGSATQSNTGAITHVWSSVGTVAGRFVHRRHAVASAAEGFMMASEFLWLCDSEAKGTIAEEQRVRSIVDTSGSAVAEAAGTWRVESLAPMNTTKLHHYELTLEKVE